MRSGQYGFNRNIDELEENAVKWWPDHIREKEAEASIVPKLIDTQEKFLSVVRLTKRNPESVIDLLKTSEFPANLFLKHLMVLSDYGSEPLQRVQRDFDLIFPNKNTLTKRIQK